LQDVFIRLLQVVWILFAILIIVMAGIFLVNLVLGDITRSMAIEAFEYSGYLLGLFAILLVIQYILIGNTSPMLLFKRKSRYPR